MTRDARLRLAAERALKACEPIVSAFPVSRLTEFQARQDGQRQVDEARGALMELEKALNQK